MEKTIEELVKEANEKYPPGTRYWNLNLIGERSQKDSTFEELPIAPQGLSFQHMDEYNRGGNIVIGIQGYGWVYANGIWAEIVETAIINNYQLY